MADLKYDTSKIRTCSTDISAAGTDLNNALNTLGEELGSIVGDYWATPGGEAFLNRFIGSAVFMVGGYVTFAEKVSQALNDAADKLDEIEQDEAPKVKYSKVGN